MDEQDPVVVGTVAARLASILQEQQTVLVSTAFSSVVRESLDLACGVFDSRGNMVGQSVGGTPGHINAMATAMTHISRAASGAEPGDVLLTNDPWMTAGQVNDITVATPIFRADTRIGWFATCCHAPDIGGRVASAEAREVYEEGLRLPLVPLFRSGQINNDVLAIIRENVRTPNETVGDLFAQASANQVGGDSLIAMLDEFGLDDFDTVAADITYRSERAMRRAIAQLPDGTYSAKTLTDGVDEPVTLHAKIIVLGDELTIDFSGSSPQQPYGINVVLNYTTAYATFAIKAALAPNVPHNAGSFRPVHVTAPPGSILNCTPPAPVASRHLVGHFIPSLIFDALQSALPDAIMAYSSDALWMTIWRGHRDSGPPYMLTVFQCGGMGARPGKDGLNATSFPSGVRAVPTEVIENMTPLVQVKRELRIDSGGAGRFRGGLGQSSAVLNPTASAVQLTGNVDRLRFPARGLAGGSDGAVGVFQACGGGALEAKRQVELQPAAVVEVCPPGGGGLGDPRTRPVAEVVRDVVDGYVSLDAARDRYGVVVRYTGHAGARVRPISEYQIDRRATATARGKVAEGTDLQIDATP